MSNYSLTAKTAFAEPIGTPLQIGAYALTECANLALVSISARKGQSLETRKALSDILGQTCDVSELCEGEKYSAFWSGPDQWFVMQSQTDDIDLEAELSGNFSGMASLSEQSDGWVGFDLEGPECGLVLERLCNVDQSSLHSGRVQRTIVEHIGAFVLCRAQGRSYRLLCGRSFAVSFQHAVETAMKTVAAP